MRSPGLLLALPGYFLHRAFQAGSRLPANLTISLLYQCNSRCRTCNVYKKKASNLKPEEYRRIFENLGTSLYWVTLSGGEPFLRNDIAEVCKLLFDICCPKVLNIATNGILTEKIEAAVRAILDASRGTTVVVNVSLDHIREKHDAIRGVPGNYEKATKTLERLNELKSQFPNLVTGIHTVVSKFNIADFRDIYTHMAELSPDSYVTEIAEKRVELDTMSSDITPSPEEYAGVAAFLVEQLNAGASRTGKKSPAHADLTRAFRMNYYRMASRAMVLKTQVIPCYAGIASAQISPEGDVWPCCVRAESIGNLRENDYDFRKIWNSAAAKRIRKSIRARECWCPLANASYTNMLMHPASMLSVLRHLLNLRLSAHSRRD